MKKYIIKKIDEARELLDEIEELVEDFDTDENE
jgi:hypothetical protein